MNDFLRTSRRSDIQCPVCGHYDWCLVSADGTAAICPRVEFGSRRYIQDSGYLHVFGSDEASRARRTKVRRVKFPSPERRVPSLDAARVADECEKAIEASRVRSLSVELGVSEASLRQLSIGWYSRGKAFAFPMRDSNRNIIGIRLRLAGGKKRAVTGSFSGLFIPKDLKMTGTLYVCEGESDTAAMRTVGLQCVGRPSCLGGVELLRNLVKNGKWWMVAIVADNDGPGVAGAQRLYRELRKFCEARVVTPPPTFKDIRGMVKSKGLVEE